MLINIYKFIKLIFILLLFLTILYSNTKESVTEIEIKKYELKDYEWLDKLQIILNSHRILVNDMEKREERTNTIISWKTNSDLLMLHVSFLLKDNIFLSSQDKEKTRILPNINLLINELTGRLFLYQEFIYMEMKTEKNKMNLDIAIIQNRMKDLLDKYNRYLKLTILIKRKQEDKENKEINLKKLQKPKKYDNKTLFKNKIKLLINLIKVIN